MKNYLLIIAVLVLITACKSATDKKIDASTKQVEQFENAVDKMDTSQIDDLMNQADTLTQQLAILQLEDLSEEQHNKVTALVLRLNTSLGMVQQAFSKQLQESMDAIQSIVDSMNMMDTLSMDDTIR